MSRPDFDYAARIGRLQSAMGDVELGAVLLSVGPDLPYFIGYEAMDSERLTMLVVTEGTPVLVVPQLEAPRVDPGPFELRAWTETEDPISVVAALAGTARRMAIGDHTRSSFLVELLRAMPDRTWDSASRLTAELRMRKDAAEIASLRAAAEGVDRVFGRIPSEVAFIGRSELDVARDLAAMTVAEGHDVAAFGIVAAGPNGASPHHEPGHRLIEEGDLIVCDFGGRVNGYYSDATRTFSAGAPAAEQTEAHAVVRAANEAGRAVVAPGVACEEIDRAARRVIEDAGLGDRFIHRTGHGIGLDVHESPYMVEGNERALEPGMTFSVEPGVYFPGRFGVRIEDIVACAPDGPDELNRAERSLIVVG